MKSIYNLQDLTQYGINILTGEADRYSMRLLCDLNEAGVALVADYFGLPFDAEFKENWNSTVNNSPAVASIMLTCDTLWAVAVWAMLTVDNFDVVIETRGYGVKGGNLDEQSTNAHLKMAEGDAHVKSGSGIRIHRNLGKASTVPGAGSRNQHAMTGRVS